MPTSTLLKCLLLICCTLTTPVYPAKHIDQTIHKLYHSLNIKPNQNLSARITAISAEFLGKPYELGALGEGLGGKYDQFPLYRTDAFDCETFVDTVLALALANNGSSFERYIRQIRYKNGLVSFVTRNHFTCLDWNINNQQQGFVTDITQDIKDKNDHPVALMAQALIDKPSWYQHFSLKNIRIKDASPTTQAARLALLKEEGSHLPSVISTIPYIPFSALFNESGEPNMQIFNQIPNAAIIEIIRPNWDLQQQIGTHLNVSHLGFAIWKNDKLLFRQASSTQHRVVDSPLIDYLRNAQKSPTIKGINIQIVGLKK